MLRIETEFGHSLPDHLRSYIDEAAPSEDFYFDAIGNPVRIYAAANLKYLQEGYNHDPVTKASIEGWNPDHFVFAGEGADPLVLDLGGSEPGVIQLIHGLGHWEAGTTLSDGIGQFLLCAAAQHHALNAFESDPVIDEGQGYLLAPAAAGWYFPNMRSWAGAYYEDWCSIFDNS